MADVYDAIVDRRGPQRARRRLLSRARGHCDASSSSAATSVGGACNTEEFAPGFRASTGAYVLSMLRESIWRDMRLVRRGVVVDPAGPTLNIVPRRRPVPARRRHGGQRRGDEAVLRRRTRPRSPPFEDDLARLVQAWSPRSTGPRPTPRCASLPRPAGVGAMGTAGVPAAPDARRPRVPVLHVARRSTCRSGSSREHVMAALGWHAINDSASPARRRRGPRSCCCTTTRARRPTAACGSGGSSAAAWAGVTELMADAAREAGCEIRHERRGRARSCTRGGRATGVRLADGEEIAARRVLSNADPKRTFLALARPRATCRRSSSRGSRRTAAWARA